MPTTFISLATFAYASGGYPLGKLYADAAGNLYGTTSAGGGPGNAGTVFKVAKDGSGLTGYNAIPADLVTFSQADGGSFPTGGLFGDGTGALFGTTSSGATPSLQGTVYNQGTVFRLTGTGSSETITTLAMFTGVNGANPGASLVEDAAGNLYGTTLTGAVPGSVGDGTVFKIARDLTSPSGYAAAPTTLVTLHDPVSIKSATGGLLIDAAGDLFGTSAADVYTVFEVKPSTNTESRWQPSMARTVVTPPAG